MQKKLTEHVPVVNWRNRHVIISIVGCGGTGSQVVTGLPSTKACLSRRSFTIRLRIPSGVTVTSATVLVNGRSVAVRRGARLRAPVNLVGLPKGRFTVKIAVRLGGGKTISGTRSYRTCAAKRKGGATPHV